MHIKNVTKNFSFEVFKGYRKSYLNHIHVVLDLIQKSMYNLPLSNITTCLSRIKGNTVKQKITDNSEANKLINFFFI